MPFVSITRARANTWRYVPSFIWLAIRSAWQARRAPGSQGVWVMGEFRRKTFWTRTLWDSEQAMRAYMGAGAHLEAMKIMSTWCDEGAVVHWTQESSTPPSWEEAHRRLLLEGRPSRLKQPSEAHKAFQVPAPEVPLVFIRLRFK